MASLAPLQFGDGERLYALVDQRLRQVVRPGESVLGTQTFWFSLHDHRYYSWEELVYYRRYKPESSLEDAFRALRPDIFVFDEHLDSFTADTEGESTYSSYLRLPRTELKAFLKQHARMVGAFTVASPYGHIEVWRIAWVQP